MHLANGAAFGVAFDRLGGRGPRQGLAAAMVETAATWPGMLLIDRFHPDRRDGTWPPLVRHGPTIAEQVLVHAVFGVVLGPCSTAATEPVASLRRVQLRRVRLQVVALARDPARAAARPGGRQRRDRGPP
jgi:hypothetical protein